MAKLSHFHFLIFVLFGAAVQAQWQWGVQQQQPNAGDDFDDDDYQQQQQQQQQQQPQQQPWWGNQGGNRNQPQPRPISTTPRPQQSPWNSPWGGQPQPQPQPQQQPWQQAPWQQQQPWQAPWQGQPQPAPQPNPAPWNQPWGPAKQPQQQPSPLRGPVTVTSTRSSQPKTAQPPPPGPTQPPQNNPPVVAQPTPTRSKTWSQPSQWGPSRSPFGPNATPSGPQTIPTTTTEIPREPVPFLTTCGRNKYVEYDVSNALITGCYYKNKTKTVNKSEFPKPFENYYGFNFGDTRGPYWEFPLIDSAAYIGGPAGPDRVIFNEQCYLAGEITQTNAGTRQWTECIEKY